MPRLLKPVKWPGRRVALSPEQTSTKVTPQNTPVVLPPVIQAPEISLIQPEDHNEVRRQLRAARATVTRVRDLANSRLDTALNIEVTGLPLTSEAVALLAGTHAANIEFVDEVDRLDPQAIDGQIYRRAYATLQRSAQLVYGFDPTQFVEPAYNGKIKSDEPVKTPQQASGEQQLTRVGLPIDPQAAAELGVTSMKRQIAKLVFYMVIALILRLFEAVVRGIGNGVRNALSIRIPIIRRRIGLGGPVSKPFYMLADALGRWAAKMEAKANGTVEQPRPTEEMTTPLATPPPPFDPGSNDPDFLEDDFTYSSDLIEDIDIETLQLNEGSFGAQYVMAAHQIVNTASMYANSHNDSALADALLLHEYAVIAEENLRLYENTAADWGVDLSVNDTDLAVPVETLPPVSANSDVFRIDCD